MATNVERKTYYRNFHNHTLSLPLPTHTLHMQLRMYQQISELQLRPLNVVMKRILDRLGRKDPANIFAKPVSLEEVGVASLPYHMRSLG